MWRGFLVSCRYWFTCWSESLRPNQVFHQNRKGMRQISHAVTKKRNFCMRDMPGLGSGASSVGRSGIGLADILEDGGIVLTTLRHRRRARAPVRDNARRHTGPEAVSGAEFR